MRRLTALVQCAHPIPAFGVSVVAVVVAAAAGAATHTVPLGLAVLAGQVGIGWSNDVLDAARDRAGGRTDKPLVTGAVSARAVWTAALVAHAASIVLGFAAGRTVGLLNLLVLGAGWAYNLGAKRTLYSPLPYAVHFAILPAWLATASLPGHPAPRPRLVVAAAVLGVASHFANTIPDAAADRATGVRGLPQRLGPDRSLLVSAALLAAGGVLLVGLPARLPARLLTAAALAVTATYAVLPRRMTPPPDRRVFYLALAVVALFVAAYVTSGARLAGTR